MVILFLTITIARTDGMVHPCRAPPPMLLAAAGLPRLKAGEIKRRLEAAGVSTVGIVEKAELVRLLKELEDNSSPSSSGICSLPMIYMQGGAYAEFDAAENSPKLRLLIDSGAATTIVSNAASASLGLGPSGRRAALISCGQPSLRLECSVASPQQQMPPGVDGILGVDSLSRFEAAELDWSSGTLRLHMYDAASSNSEDSFEALEASSIPMEMRRVAAGTLPFVRATFGGRAVDSLIDTGSPVTMVTPELAQAAAVVPRADRGDDIITTGVDGQPTRMRASTCGTLALGGDEGGDDVGTRGVLHTDAIVYAGTCPMMAMVGWEGTQAALLGLDVLRVGVRGGQPPTAAAGGPASGRLVLDFARRVMLVGS